MAPIRASSWTFSTALRPSRRRWPRAASRAHVISRSDGRRRPQSAAGSGARADESALQSIKRKKPLHVGCRSQKARHDRASRTPNSRERCACARGVRLWPRTMVRGLARSMIVSSEGERELALPNYASAPAKRPPKYIAPNQRRPLWSPVIRNRCRLPSGEYTPRPHRPECHTQEMC